MGIAEDIYARCRHTLAESATMISAAADGVSLDPITVSARRTAADLSDEVALCGLARAFITPLEREDLWQLRRCAEKVRCAAEEVCLCVGGNVPYGCMPLLEQSARGCAAIGRWFDPFPRLECGAPLRPIRDAQWHVHTLRRERLGDVSVRRVTDAVAALLELLIALVDRCRYIFLKNG